MASDGANLSTWLAASYHFPATYACRAPMSGIASGLALPAPGPSTVRLALIRTGVELFGIAYTREVLFPALRNASIGIHPPAQVAISTQTLRVYKASSNPHRPFWLDESVGYREIAQASGAMTLYIQIPVNLETIFRQTLSGIGYWGSADSFASCTAIVNRAPTPGECALPLSSLAREQKAGKFFSCLVAEFSQDNLTWAGIQPGATAPCLRVQVYIWPLEPCERTSRGKLMRYRSLCE